MAEPASDKWYNFHSIKERRENWGESGWRAIFVPWAFVLLVYTPVFFNALRRSKFLWHKALGSPPPHDPKNPPPSPREDRDDE